MNVKQAVAELNRLINSGASYHELVIATVDGEALPVTGFHSATDQVVVETDPDLDIV